VVTVSMPIAYSSDVMSWAEKSLSSTIRTRMACKDKTPSFLMHMQSMHARRAVLISRLWPEMRSAAG